MSVRGTRLVFCLPMLCVLLLNHLLYWFRMDGNIGRNCTWCFVSGCICRANALQMRPTSSMFKESNQSGPAYPPRQCHSIAQTHAVDGLMLLLLFMVCSSLVVVVVVVACLVAWVVWEEMVPSCSAAGERSHCSTVPSLFYMR